MKRARESSSYRTFEDLKVYQVARGFRKAMCQMARRLPDFERFALADQVRAAVSVTNNIAEGHGRSHFLDQIKFMLLARGSLEELLDDLNVCENETYLPNPEIESLRSQAWRVHKLINGYVRFLRTQKADETSRVKELLTGESSGNPENLDAPLRFNASTLQRFKE